MVNDVLSNAHFSSLIISFSEPLDPVSATSTTLYTLIEAGPNGTFDNLDDIVVPISTITYTPGSTDVRVFFSGQLADGNYRFTISGAAGNAVVDTAGNAIDGDGNGTVGGNFVRAFHLDLTAPTVVSVTPSGAVASGPTQYSVVFADNRNLLASTVTANSSYILTSSTNATFGDYLVAVNADVPDMEVLFVGEPDPMTPTGTLLEPSFADLLAAVEQAEGERGQRIDLHQGARGDGDARLDVAALLQRDERQDNESCSHRVGVRRVLHRRGELEVRDH